MPYFHVQAGGRGNLLSGNHLIRLRERNGDVQEVGEAALPGQRIVEPVALTHSVRGDGYKRLRLGGLLAQ